jgi:hypothetical protein
LDERACTMGAVWLNAVDVEPGTEKKTVNPWFTIDASGCRFYDAKDTANA